jgi:acetolactate synthase-1/3 small subunit
VRSKILIAYVHDKPGVLTKIASIFYRRGINIRTLTVAGTHQPDVSKIVFRLAGHDEEVRRLMLSVGNLIDVISVDTKDDTGYTARELCLARVATKNGLDQVAVLAAVAQFGARIVQRDDASCVFELADAPERIDAFVATLSGFTLIDLSRTGATAIPETTAVDVEAARIVSPAPADSAIELPQTH